PVRIQLDDVDRPKGLRFGGRAGVIAFPTDNGLMNMLGDFRIWLASIWNYVG
ncbi:MAG: HlyD family secretion protein, partial [Rhodospirillaceae bacterium]|nr:HlyD family secretion protein [Rhodospirillaceae bacterium]